MVQVDQWRHVEKLWWKPKTVYFPPEREAAQKKEQKFMVYFAKFSPSKGQRLSKLGESSVHGFFLKNNCN